MIIIQHNDSAMPFDPRRDIVRVFYGDDDVIVGDDGSRVLLLRVNAEPRDAEGGAEIEIDVDLSPEDADAACALIVDRIIKPRRYSSSHPVTIVEIDRELLGRFALGHIYSYGPGPVSARHVSASSPPGVVGEIPRLPVVGLP